MEDWARISTGLALAWALGALVWQVIAAWGGGRRDYSQRRASPWRGVAYNFTTAMLPSHKESARLHPFKFAVGVVLHVGTLIALLVVLLLVFAPAWAAALGSFTVPLLFLALAAGGYLLVRRMRSPVLAAMSAPDDYAAIGASMLLLLLTALHGLGQLGTTILLLYSTALLVYVPLGKLRHIAFFFVARTDYGRRLGHRGVYPIATTGESRVGG